MMRKLDAFVRKSVIPALIYLCVLILVFMVLMFVAIRFVIALGEGDFLRWQPAPPPPETPAEIITIPWGVWVRTENNSVFSLNVFDKSPSWNWEEQGSVDERFVVKDTCKSKELPSTLISQAPPNIVQCHKFFYGPEVSDSYAAMDSEKQLWVRVNMMASSGGLILVVGLFIIVTIVSHIFAARLVVGGARKIGSS